MNIQVLLTEIIKKAMIKAGAPSSCDPLIKLSAKKQFGDYQANGMMCEAKKLNINPREFASNVVNQIETNDLIEKHEIAGPGFINLFIKNDWLCKQNERALSDQKLDTTTSAKPQNIVIDYSAPNIAKEMHVGHIRSTIIGDVGARVLSYLGHHVIRANHVGDWGTQFGMLIAYLEKQQNENAENMEIADLENFYRSAKKLYDEDENFAKKSREYVVKLQGGDDYCLTMWRKLVDITMQQNMKIYRRLNVTLTLDDTMGESLYNNMLPELISDLSNKGLAVKSDGATVIYLEEYKNKDGDPMAVIIQKRDGGYLYATTDIACIKYRYNTLKADRVLYYTDSRQHQHLAQIFQIAKMAQYIPESLPLEHHMFGMILGKDGKPFKTRSGDTIKLNDLLDEAFIRATKLITQKNPNLTQDELTEIVDAVAIGAVKYADLSKNRTTDYIFDWNNMLSFEGNTAPYLQYAYTRIYSIFRKANLDINAHLPDEIIIDNDKERALSLKLSQFDEALQTVAREGLPHILCTYLYELATLFSSFYEACPILGCDNYALKMSRLKLSMLCAKTLKTGLNLLGIKTINKM